MGTESKYYLEILKKLEGSIRKDYLQYLLFGVQTFVAAVLINFTFYALLELIANFSSTVRTILIILFILLALGLLVLFLVKPILKYIGSIRKETYFDAAVKVGRVGDLAQVFLRKQASFEDGAHRCGFQ